MTRSTRLGFLCTAVLALGVSAQVPSETKTGRPDPLNPKAAVPPLDHVSAFAAYRPAGELKVGSWKEANDTVARIGGWRAYAREASRPDPAVPDRAPAPAGSASRPLPGPAGHGMH